MNADRTKPVDPLAELLLVGARNRELRHENERLRAAMWEAIRLCAAKQPDDAADILQRTLERS